MDYEVFASDMEYPEGTTDEQALAIVKAFEMRRFAAEFEWQMECEEDAWVDDAKQLIEDGKVTASELVEEAFRMFWDGDIRDPHVCFSEAVEDFVRFG